MERTVPSTASEEIDLYVRTIYSLLRSTTQVQIRTLEEVHGGIHSLLHPGARLRAPDLSAFIYSILRLPACMPQVRSIVLGQSLEVFCQYGYGDLETWQLASARARRRRAYYDRGETLACFIASRSDIEDIVPSLVAYQVEWNKMHLLLQRWRTDLSLEQAEQSPDGLSELAACLEISLEDLERLHSAWGEDFARIMQTIAARPCSFGIRLLSGSLNDYRRATQAWWENVERAFPDLARRPVYFISSNTHSVANLLSGFALQRRDELEAFIEASADRSLAAEWRAQQSRRAFGGRENFLYYALRKYQQDPSGSQATAQQLAYERSIGVLRVPSEHLFDVEAQVIELARLDVSAFDPRLKDAGLGFLERSDALILNIDYPLGLAAYNILVKVAEQVNPLLGVYIMGKSAALNCAIGDVLIPNVVHDEQSRNTYLYQNAFQALDVAPYLMYGTVLDNQKSVSVAGTFLQNADFMDVFYREGYTDIEMEAGPYLSAVYEMYRPKRHPADEIVNLYGVPFDIGVLHYASDTPLSKGKNLGAGALSYLGMDSTYATSLAILRRILAQERRRVGGS
jgi:hypothetical protein